MPSAAIGDVQETILVGPGVMRLDDGIDQCVARLGQRKLFQKPTDYLLIEPGGITVLVPRGQEGAVIQAEGKWRYNRGFMRSWMGRDEAIGNPSADAQKAMADIKKVLDEKAPEIKVPLRAVIVFTHPRVALTAEPGPVTALRAEELKDYLRAAGKLHELPKSIQRKMREALGAPDVASE